MFKTMFKSKTSAPEEVSDFDELSLLVFSKRFKKLPLYRKQLVYEQLLLEVSEAEKLGIPLEEHRKKERQQMRLYIQELEQQRRVQQLQHDSETTLNSESRTRVFNELKSMTKSMVDKTKQSVQKGYKQILDKMSDIHLSVLVKKRLRPSIQAPPPTNRINNIWGLTKQEDIYALLDGLSSRNPQKLEACLVAQRKTRVVTPSLMKFKQPKEIQQQFTFNSVPRY